MPAASGQRGLAGLHDVPVRRVRVVPVHAAVVGEIGPAVARAAVAVGRRAERGPREEARSRCAASLATSVVPLVVPESSDVEFDSVGSYSAYSRYALLSSESRWTATRSADRAGSVT